MPKPTGFNPLGTFLTNIIPQEHSWKIKLFGQWKNIIGHLSEKVRIEKITESSITLGVCHATWAHELFLLSPMIKKKINNLLREEKIKNIHFRTVTLEKKIRATGVLNPPGLGMLFLSLICFLNYGFMIVP